MKIKTRCTKCTKINEVDQSKMNNLINCMYCAEEFRVKYALRHFENHVEENKPHILIKVAMYLMAVVFLTILVVFLSVFIKI